MAQMPSIGMSVPGASALMGGVSPADQVKGETDEERKKRMAAITGARQLPAGMTSLADGYGSALSTS